MKIFLILLLSKVSTVNGQSRASDSGIVSKTIGANELQGQEQGPLENGAFNRRAQSTSEYSLIQDLRGDAPGDQFGTFVQVSSNGLIVAVGAPYNDVNGSLSGQVKVFERDGNNYTVISTLYGDAADDQFGKSLSLNDQGSVLAVGAPFNDGYSGQVKVFERSGNNYTVISTLYGDAAYDQFGDSLSLNDQGSVLAVGARSYDGIGSNSGQVKVLELPMAESPASTTSTPWDIIPYNTTVDFSEDSGEKENLVTEYKIGEGRAYDHKLQAGSCDAPKDANLTTNVGHTVEASKSSTGPVADGYEMLTLKHGFSKGMIADSSIWKEGEDMIELCETVQLTLPDGDNGLMVVSELKSNVTITFDLSQNFKVDPGITLEEATIQANNETSSLSDYIDAYMCGSFGEELTGNELTLKQNTPLSICIESKSEDVLVDEVTSMVIKGKKPNTNSAEDSSLTVIQDNSHPTYSAITSITGVDTKKVTISTFIPPDRFDYSATDAKIDVSGSLLLKFAESPARKLEVSLSNRMLQVNGVANEEEAVEFDIIINIAPEEAGGLDKAMMSSALGLAGNIFAMIGLAVGATYALW